MNIAKLFYWLLNLFVAYLIFEVIRKILGGSLGFEELVSGFLIANIGYLAALQGKISKVEVRLSEQTAKVQAQLSEHIGWHKGKDHQKNNAY